MRKLKAHEGFVGHVYKNVKGYRTLGYGHLVTKQTPAVLSSVHGLSKDTINGILNGKIKITETQAEHLLSHNASQKERNVRSFFPKYNKYGNDLKNALVNARFRGNLGAKYAVTKAIRANQWGKAAKMMKQSSDYKRFPGVKKRLNEHVEVLQKYQRRKMTQQAVTAAGLVGVGALGVKAGMNWYRQRGVKSHRVENSPKQSIVSHRVSNKNLRVRKVRKAKKSLQALVHVMNR
jgi:GH24 family phage-related lysozyme (muramidase)